MSAKYITEYPELVISALGTSGVPSDIAAGLFVKPDGTQCGQGEKAIGISNHAATAGKDLAINAAGMFRIECVGTVAAGDAVAANAAGKAVKAPADTEIIELAADLALTTEDTLQDTLLKFAGGVNEKHHVKLKLFIANAKAAGALSVDFALDVPANATAVGSIRAANAIAAASNFIDSDADLTSEISFEIATAELSLIEIDAVIDTGDTAGDVMFQFAQHVSGSDAITLKAGSILTHEIYDKHAINGYCVVGGSNAVILVSL